MNGNGLRVAIAVTLALSMLMWAPAAAAYGTAAAAGSPGDVEIGDETQTIADVEVDVDDAGQDGVDVYYDVTALSEEADVDLDSLGVEVDGVTDAEVVDQDVNQDDGNTVVRVSFDVAEDADSFTVDEIALTGLGTADASEADGLAYHVAVDSDERVGDEAPGTEDAETDAFAVLDAEEDEETATDEPDTETDAPDDGDDDADDGDADDGADSDASSDDGDADADEPEDVESDDDAPGFGAVAALLAVIGAAFVATRR